MRRLYRVYRGASRRGFRGVGDDHLVPPLAQHAAHPREVSVRFNRQAFSRLRSPGALHGRRNRPVVSPLGMLLDLRSILVSDSRTGDSTLEMTGSTISSVPS